jgi:hypothetical protein
MRRDQICYWLQGHFEIGDHFGKESLADPTKNQFLTDTQVVCIRNHVQLHFECARREKEEPGPFISWLDGALTYFEHLPQPQQEQLVLEIRKRLNAIFIHVIDPAMPGDKASLQAIHDGVAKAVAEDGEAKPPESKDRTESKRRGRPGPRGGLNRGGRETRFMC